MNEVAMVCALILTVSTQAASGQSSPGNAVPVTVENFIRAETDMYFGAVALKEGGFGKFEHHRELSPIDNQTIIRMNRDTLYSAAVFDLDAGPVTITLPDAGKRFMSMQLISEDQYSPPAVYGAGKHTVTQAAGRHALHARRRPDAGRSKRPDRRGEGPRAAGCDQGRAAGRPGQVRGAEMGPGQPEEGP